MRKTWLLGISMLALVAVAQTAFGLGPDYSIENTVWGDIYFAKGSAALSDEAKKNLTDVSVWIKKHPKSMVLLAGYDEKGGTDAADTGRKRADAVADFLAGAGVDSSAIKSIGFGDTKSSGVSEPERSKDRRVRYRIVDMSAGGDMQGGKDPMSGVCQRCKK